MRLPEQWRSSSSVSEPALSSWRISLSDRRWAGQLSQVVPAATPLLLSGSKERCVVRQETLEAIPDRSSSALGELSVLSMNHDRQVSKGADEIGEALETRL
eukprot:1605607-Rhodomonas_salina.4